MHSALFIGCGLGMEPACHTPALAMCSFYHLYSACVSVCILLQTGSIMGVQSAIEWK